MSDEMKVPERLYIPHSALAEYHEKSPCLPAFEPVCVGDPHEVFVHETISKLTVPGMWQCPKCKFVLTQRTLNAHDGTVSSRDATGEKCPNCDVPLWRVSWEEYAQSYTKAFEDTWNDLQVLKADTAAAAKLLIEALGNEYAPQNPLWGKIMDAVSSQPNTGSVRGSDGILIALRAISEGAGE